MINLQECNGKFITFEGIEGVGKSTQVNLLAEELHNAGVQVVTTREPGGTQIAEQIRNMILAHNTEKITPVTELLLLFAARAQHIAGVIQPALQAGKCVLCDRFTDASYAYQGGGRGMDLQYIAQLENLVQGELRPDLTLLLDIQDINLCLTRAKGTGPGDRIEQEKLDFFERARNAYLSRAKANAYRFKIIDATRSVADIQHDILQAIYEKFATS